MPDSSSSPSPSPSPSPSRHPPAAFDGLVAKIPPLDPRKFRDPQRTAAGEIRAAVAFDHWQTLWINTGSLCNITCHHCYMDSSPRNDRLAFLAWDEVRPFLDELDALAADGTGTGAAVDIGLTGGEPFMNPDIIALLDGCLTRGHGVLVLTNAMKPMTRHRPALLELRRRHGDRLRLRVSLDHPAADRHDALRGPGTWAVAVDGLAWLAEHGFPLSVAGRPAGAPGRPEPDAALRQAYAALFAARGWPVDALDPGALVLFPELDAGQDVPEITTACWGLLGRAPRSVMCATARMLVRRQGDARPGVVACTLLPDDPRFALGATLTEATATPVALNHPFCARFCVLGGASCSR